MNVKYIIDICDQLIEDAQTTLMNQTELTNKITFNLSKYSGYYDDDERTKKINKEIIDYLNLQEIRLYEDESDENGMIINSKEIYSKIFENITIESDNRNNSIINLFFSQAMIDLLS